METGSKMTGYTQNDIETFVNGMIKYISDNTRFAESTTQEVMKLKRKVSIQGISIWLLIICIWLLMFLK